jgi:hypothetical protein
MVPYESSVEQTLSVDESHQVRPGEILLGSVMAIDDQGRPLVDFSGNPRAEALAALATVPVGRSSIGRTVALLFAGGDIAQPVVMGFIQNPLDTVLEMTVDATNELHTQRDDVGAAEKLAEELHAPIESVKVDDERVVIEGQKEIVLKCGDASITLTRAGKILIRGKYLLNRSSGVNRIMGGSVQVN